MPGDRKYGMSKSSSIVQNRTGQLIGRNKGKYARLPDPVLPDANALQTRARQQLEERMKEVNKRLGRTKTVTPIPVHPQQPLAGNQDDEPMGEPMDTGGFGQLESPNNNLLSDHDSDWDDEQYEEDDSIDNTTAEALQSEVDKIVEVQGAIKVPRAMKVPTVPGNGNRHNYTTKTNRRLLWDGFIGAATGQFALIGSGKLPCSCTRRVMTAAISLSGMVIRDTALTSRLGAKRIHTMPEGMPFWTSNAWDPYPELFPRISEVSEVYHPPRRFRVFPTSQDAETRLCHGVAKLLRSPASAR